MFMNKWRYISRARACASGGNLWNKWFGQRPRFIGASKLDRANSGYCACEMIRWNSADRHYISSRTVTYCALRSEALLNAHIRPFPCRILPSAKARPPSRGMRNRAAPSLIVEWRGDYSLSRTYANNNLFLSCVVNFWKMRANRNISFVLIETFCRIIISIITHTSGE